MFHIFDENRFKDKEEFENYLYSRIEDYVRNTKSDIDTLNVIDFISVLKSYIETKCPKKEHNTLRLISLITSSIDKNGSGVTSVDLTFASLLAEEPDTWLPVKYTLIKPSIDNETICDTLYFLKYNLLLTITEEAEKDGIEVVKKRYNQESKLLSEAIETVENILDAQEELEGALDMNEPMEMSTSLRDSIKKFVDEYKPPVIKAHLDKYIIGQEEAKKTMSIAIYNHMNVLLHPEKKMKKNNVLMVGPSGCGKSEIMRVLAEILPVPISFFDTSGVTQSGWKGDKKIVDCVKQLVATAPTPDAAEYGIVFLDEFDKMCAPSFNSNGENVSTHVQGEVLALVEGANIEVPLSNENAMIQQSRYMNTKNILFIAAGAFDGIEEVVKRKRNENSSIGFYGTPKANSDTVTAKDISKDVVIEFGVTPELAGRLSIVTVLHKLTKQDMLDILTKCEDNVMTEVKNLGQIAYDVEIEVTNEAMIKLIDKLCTKVGARGLRSAIYEYFVDILFEVSVQGNIKKVILRDDLTVKYISKKINNKKLNNPIKEHTNIIKEERNS